MKSIDFTAYENSKFAKVMQDAFKATEENGVLTFKNHGVDGIVHHYSLGNILHIRVNDISISENLKVNYQPIKDMVSCYFFYKLETDQPILFKDQPINHDILCVKNSSPLSYTVHKNSTAKSIFIAISRDFYNDQKRIKNTIIEDVFNSKEVCLLQMETPQIKALCKKLIEVQKNLELRNHLSIGIAIELLGYFFELLNERDGSIPPTTLKDHNFDQVIKARTLLLADLKNPPIIDDLAIKVSSSSSQLRKYFKELFGQPIYQYYKNYKLELSYMWLHDGVATIKEAANRTGYSSNSKFTAEFKKYHGVLPSDIQAV